ncbi:helix-turn-helix transcriptional regulator, partial [Streptomyces sp. NPDC050704]|uniref:helix-turn-helix domain-containing protein n=1 Tax=Streptomyces sp. NPDC050704 TaxID=3157219 RepID=UPI0034217415
MLLPTSQPSRPLLGHYGCSATTRRACSRYTGGTRVWSAVTVLRALKERRGVSYEALARDTGIGRSSLHRYCSG